MTELFKPTEVSRIGHDSPPSTFHSPSITPEQNRIFSATREANRNNIPAGFPHFDSVPFSESSKQGISPSAKPLEGTGSKEKEVTKETKDTKITKADSAESKESKEPKEPKEKREKKEKEHKEEGKKLKEPHSHHELGEKEPKSEDQVGSDKDRKDEERFHDKNIKKSPDSCKPNDEGALKLNKGIPELGVSDFYSQTKCGADGKPIVSTFDLDKKLTGKLWTESDGRKVAESFGPEGRDSSHGPTDKSQTPTPNKIDQDQAEKGRIMTAKHEVYPNGDFDYTTYDKRGKPTGGESYFDEKLKTK